MLDVFRQRGIMSAVYSVILGAVMVVFVVEFRPSAGAATNPLTRRCVAKVRGTCIDEKDWRTQRYLLRADSRVSTNWNKAGVDSLVERTLLEQEASRLGVRVSEEDVTHEIVRWRVHVTVPMSLRAQIGGLGVDQFGARFMPFGTKEKPFDQQTFERVVQGTTGMTATEFVEAQQHELVAARVLGLVASRVRVSEVEAWEQYQQDRSTTSIGYVKFEPNFFADRFAAMDPATIEKWAVEHKAEVDAHEATLPKDQERRLMRPRHILIEVKKDATDEKKAEARKQADDLLAQVKGGADFAQLAREHSTDPGSKYRGGEYDWTAGYEYVPEFRDGLAALKPGETSIVQTQYGFHVLQLIARVDGPVAVALPLYRAEMGSKLAQKAADDVREKLAGKVPVAIDAELTAKIEEAKKGGRAEAEARAEVVWEATKARVEAALQQVLGAMTPTVASPKDTKGTTTAEAAKPAWASDDRRPRMEESSAFNRTGSPVVGLEDQAPVVEAAFKLTPEAPASTVTAGKENFLLVLHDQHTATRSEFDKDRASYIAPIVAKKREDAIQAYLTSLRDSVGKDLTVESKYVAEDKKDGTGGVPMPMEEE